MKKLVVIDDNKDFLELMLISLGKLYDCAGFTSRSDFFENYDYQNLDLLICDYNVCGEEAPEIIQSIKDAGHLREQPVIVISGSDVKSLTEYNVHNGYYLEKPFKISDLKEVVSGLFDTDTKEASEV